MDAEAVGLGRRRKTVACYRASSDADARSTAKAVMIQAGENPACGVVAQKRQTAATGLFNAPGRGSFRLATDETGSRRLPEDVRKKRSTNSSTRKARKGKPVSPCGDATEVRKLSPGRVSGRFLVRPAEIAKTLRCGSGSAGGDRGVCRNYARAGA